MSEAPFKPGDRVVRTGPSYPECNMHRGSTYTVTDIWYCCPGAGWRMGVAEASDSDSGLCQYCDRPIDGKKHGAWGARYFSKLDDLCNVDSLLEQLSEPVRELEPA